MGAPITIHLDEATLLALDELAGQTDRSRDELVAQAIREMVAGESHLPGGPDVERWLREAVAPTYDAVMANPPATTGTASETWDALQAHMARSARAMSRA